MIRTIVVGAGGHMGRILIDKLEADECFEIVCKVDAMGSNADVTDINDYTGEADMIIDFSHHLGTKSITDYIKATGTPAIICTTGQDEAEMAMIEEASKSAAVFKSGNMSVGIALLTKLVRQAAAVFPTADVEIVETHHNRKADAPSGTALMLANAVMDVRPELHTTDGRSGQHKRTPDEIGMHAVRRGNVVGIHEVMFGTNNQTITITHEAHDRALFADGALDAAKFMIGKEPGMYNMDDLVG